MQLKISGNYCYVMLFNAVLLNMFIFLNHVLVQLEGKYNRKMIRTSVWIIPLLKWLSATAFVMKSSCSFLVSLAILAIILWENIWLKKFYTFFLLSKYKSSILRYKYYFLITLFIYWKEIIKTIVQLNLYLIVSKLHSEWWLRSFSFKFYGKRFFVKIVSAQIFAYAATKRFMTKDKWTMTF